MTGGKSELQPIFTSDTVQVQREEEAFSFGSLVADIGGVLGLFIGFNFLTNGLGSNTDGVEKSSLLCIHICMK